MSFKISAPGPRQKIHLHHLPQKKEAILRKPPAEPEKKRRKDRKQENSPLLCFQPEQLSRSQKVQTTHCRDHPGVPALRQKSQGKEKTAEIQPLMVLPYAEHAEHRKGEKQKEERIRISGPGQVGRQGPFIGAEEGQHQNGGFLAVPLREKGADSSCKQISKGRRKTQSQHAVAEQAEAQHNSPVADGGLQVPVIRLIIVGMADIIAVLYHFIGVHPMARLVPGVHILHVQAAEAKERQRTYSQRKKDPVIFFKYMQKRPVKPDGRLRQTPLSCLRHPQASSCISPLFPAWTAGCRSRRCTSPPRTDRSPPGRDEGRPPPRNFPRCCASAPAGSAPHSAFLQTFSP